MWRVLSARCITQMLVGEDCGRKADVTPEVFEKAKRRITSALAFVGLTEHWDLSVCLYVVCQAETLREADARQPCRAAAVRRARDNRWCACPGLTQPFHVATAPAKPCRFHSMFGGDARATSFVNTRAGQAIGSKDYKV